jgi:hypothetical protein
MPTRDEGTVPCRKCGTPRAWYGRMKPDSMCRACRARSISVRTWPYRQDTLADKAERKAKRWVTPSERPVLDGLRSGTRTEHGTVQARGMRDGSRYYLVIDEAGRTTELPAHLVESDNRRNE